MIIKLKTVKSDFYFSLLMAIGLFTFCYAATVTHQHLVTLIVANVLAIAAGLLLIVTTAQWVLYRIYAAQLDQVS